MSEPFLDLNQTTEWNQWKPTNNYKQNNIYIYKYIYIYIVSCGLFWLHGIAQCHHKDPLPKGVSVQWSLRGFFFEMTLGNANVYMVPFAIYFTTHIQHVFWSVFVFVVFCISYCLWHCSGVSQINPLPKRGWQHKCKGQLALQKHAAVATGRVEVPTFYQGFRG